MLIALILIFIAVPALEIYLFVRVGELIGAVPTVALALLAAGVGAAVIRMQAPRAIAIGSGLSARSWRAAPRREWQRVVQAQQRA